VIYITTYFIYTDNSYSVILGFFTIISNYLKHFIIPVIGYAELASTTVAIGLFILQYQTPEDEEIF